MPVSDLDIPLASHNTDIDIGGTVHFSHATFTYLRSDLVVGDGRVDHAGESTGLARVCQP